MASANPYSRRSTYIPQSELLPSTSHITSEFASILKSTSKQTAKDDPNYYTEDPKHLISTSTIDLFTTGTGSAIYRSLAPILESANHELILVTCFWAQSSSLQTLNDILRKLSEKSVRRGNEKIRVRLCYSSSSIFQKLFHSQSVNGQPYDPSVWVKKLGLPPSSELAGLDIQIKSVFLLPFCVMHPKFMIIDRQKVVLPSCNISWEEWFEGCITFSGPIVEQFLRFYSEFWERSSLPNISSTSAGSVSITNGQIATQPTGLDDLRCGHITRRSTSAAGITEMEDIATVFLPSPHRRNPRFHPFLPTENLLAPPTPLNAFVLVLFEKAERSIRIQTPNLTSPPVLSGLLNALSRGIDVRILTSEKLMVLEQLVTAGTTTLRCVKKLIKRYKILSDISAHGPANDEEAVISTPRPGRLQISYFSPMNSPKPKGQEAGQPQQSHLKMTIVDNEVLVLGSGNLDRASWFTSQELGVAFFDRTLAERVGSTVDEAMHGRSRVAFDSRDRSTL